jgi:hypothetical protein
MAGKNVERVAEEAEERKARSQEFQDRVEEGNYENLLDASLRRILVDAAHEPGMDIEIGSLRFLINRLISEEQDLNKLVPFVSRLTEASVQAIRLRGSQPDGADDGERELSDALNKMLAIYGPGD